MNKSRELRTGRHCVFMMHVHLVFVTKYRRNIFSKKVLQHLEKVFTRVCERFECTLSEFDGEKDHVHLLVNFPPKVSISKLVNSLKGVSSRMIHEFHRSYGVKVFGLLAILRDLVEESLLILLEGTLTPKTHPIEAPYILTLKGRGFTAELINRNFRSFFHNIFSQIYELLPSILW